MEPAAITPTVEGTPTDSGVALSDSKLCKSDCGSQPKASGPIAALPPETLLQIFTSLVEGGRFDRPSSHRCIRLTRVCRFWREVVLAAPHLWTKIENHGPAWINVMLKHSKTAPLTVHIWGKATSKLIEPIFKHLARIEKLEISDWDKENWEKMKAFIEANASTTPLLRSVKLANAYKQAAWMLPAAMFQHSVQLQDVRLGNISVDWMNLPNELPNLTRLRLDIGSYEYRPTWSELTAGFERMPALKDLTLTGTLRSRTNHPNSGALVHLSCLERVSLRECSVEAATIFLDRFKLSQDLQILTIDDVYSLADRTVLRQFYNNVRDAVPSLISRVGYLNIERDGVSEDFNERKVTIEGLTTLRDGFYGEEFHCSTWRDTDADIKLELNFSREVSPKTILENAFDILPFHHVTQIRIGAFLGYGEILAILQKLPELQAIIVFEEATVHLVKALVDLQTQADETSAGLIFPMLTHIGIHRDHSKIPRKLGWERCVRTHTWTQLKEFLENRKARNAEMHSLDIMRCWFIARDDVKCLEDCARTVEWDGCCREKTIEQHGPYERISML